MRQSKRRPSQTAMDIPEAYAEWSATYDSDRNLTRDLSYVVVRQTLENQHCKSILEIGCGTGNNTGLLAQIGKRVWAVDFSACMLDLAREKLRLDNVSFTAADLTKPWPCAKQSIDLIVCSLVLEHIRDLDFIFSEAFRVLAPAGRFFICELHPFRQYQGTRATFERAEQTIEIPAFVHHFSDFIDVAAVNCLSLESVREWWHDEDQNKLPRLVSFVFEKAG